MWRGMRSVTSPTIFLQTSFCSTFVLMDDSLFARLGYDPTRIFAHFYGQPASGGICRLGGLARTEEVPGDGPAAVSAASADWPPGAKEEPTGSAAAPVPPPAGKGTT